MSYPSYPEYKSTQIAWLAQIPSHWSIDKFRYVFKESQEVIQNRVVGEMLSVSGYRGIETKIYDDENRKRTKEELIGYRVVRKGQLVVNTMWLNYAGLGVSELEGHVSPAYRSYWIERDVDKRFIHHLMRSSIYVQGYTQLLTGIRPNSLQMSRDNLLSFPVILPPKTEQTQIARFLDHQTARIDALIAKKHGVNEILVESNFGGVEVYAQILKPYLTKAEAACRVEPIRSNKQKELRIIDTLAPVLQTHRFAVDRRVVEADADLVKNAKDDKDVSYSLFYQLTRLTHDRGSLLHDDRLDAVAMAVQWFQEQAAQNQFVRAQDRMSEMIAATVADENGWMLMSPDRQAFGMTLEQAKRAEAMTKGSGHSWI